MVLKKLSDLLWLPNFESELLEDTGCALPLAGEASVLVGAPQGSLLPLFPPEGAAGAPPEPQGSPPDLTPAEGGEEEPPANTRGEPLEGGTPTPPIVSVTLNYLFTIQKV